MPRDRADRPMANPSFCAPHRGVPSARSQGITQGLSLRAPRRPLCAWIASLEHSLEIKGAQKRARERKQEPGEPGITCQHTIASSICQLGTAHFAPCISRRSRLVRTASAIDNHRWFCCRVGSDPEIEISSAFRKLVLLPIGLRGGKALGRRFF